MEKRKPHYDLNAIKIQMSDVEAMHLTMVARHGIKSLGITVEDALKIVQNLSSDSFYKAMTVHADNRIWQDGLPRGMEGKTPLYQVPEGEGIFYRVLQGALNMSKKWNGEKCPVCFQGTLHQGRKQTQFHYRGHTLDYEQEGAWCDTCEEGILTGKEAEASEPILDEFMARVEKEEASELARIRKKLGLSQKEAAMIAGGGHNAFSRYECGEAKPVAAVLNLFRLLDLYPELLKDLRKWNIA